MTRFAVRTSTGSTTSRQTLLSPFPAFGSNAINATENTGYSWYHSFQFTASKRFSKGYTVMGSYTYAKWMQAVNLLNAVDPLPIREISDADAPHRINISSIYELPFGQGKRMLTHANPDEAARLLVLAQEAVAQRWKTYAEMATRGS